MQMKKPEKGMEVNVFAINNYKDKVMGIMEVKDWRLFLALVLALATHTCAHTHLTRKVEDIGRKLLCTSSCIFLNKARGC